MATPEGKTKNSIKKFLKKNDIWYVMITPSVFGNSVGVSDFQCLKRGKFFVIEAKRGDKPSKPTANQIEYMNKVKINGGLAFLVSNDEDLSEVEASLKYYELI